MEYTKRRRYTINVANTDLQDVYTHDLQMYDFPPRGDMSLVEFERLGRDRLKALQHVENNAVRTDFKTLEDRKQNLSTTLGKDGLKYFMHLLYGKGCKASTEMDLQSRKRDHISHFILRLSFCRDLDRQKWFINQEVELFKLRFSSLNKEGVERLLNMHKFDCQQLSQEEKEELREELRSSTSKIANVETTEFYKVPFQKVADLVRSRRVYVNQGMAYTPYADLVSLVASYFRKHLTDAMPHARWCLANICEDERIATYFTSLPRTFSSATQVVWTSTTTPIDKLDELSKTSYPLCMRVLHEALRTQHHLKNSGRIQYGLFIKGIGVTLQDALTFWRTEFTKKIEPDKFDKQYAYTVRHTYGKEGKQTNYTPLGCPKIISSAVGPGEYHGCPYKHMDYSSLKQRLFSYGLPAASVNEIADLSKEGSYLIACTTYFKVLHNRLPDKPILHPNGYFSESRAILAKDSGTEQEKEKLSQGGRMGGYSQGVSTPRGINSSFGTPLRSAATPLRSVTTPLRNVNTTPLRKVERTSTTPVRATKPTPKRIENHLNADEIADLMSDDEMWGEM